jgi:phosphatidylglycerophosphatase C
MLDSSTQITAAFDFDKTLTPRDTLKNFLFFSVGKTRAIFFLFLSLPYLLGYCVGLSSRARTKEVVMTRFFKGTSYRDLQLKGDEFAKNYLPKIVKPEGLQRIKWHQDQGHRCILVSANLEVFLESWAKSAGFVGCIATRLKVSPEGIITGKLLGPNCWGEEKVRRLKEMIGNDHVILYAYGDSRGDRELLAIADYPYYRKLG